MNTIEAFKKTRKQLLKVVSDFPEDKHDVKFYDSWTIKEVLGHICGWDVYFTHALESLEKGKKVEYWGSINKFNDDEVKKRKNKTFFQLEKELEQTGSDFASVYSNLGNELKKKPIWEGKKYTAEDLLKIQIHHYESQSKQIVKRYS